MTEPSPHDWNGHAPDGHAEDATRELLAGTDPELLRRSAQTMLDALTDLTSHAQEMMAAIEKHCAEREQAPA